ncbi:MAG: hypothetical protein OEY64_04915 [Nitrospinota bacterium]|nr:hypothetical protein [Nitrospinota bacterium]
MRHKIYRELSRLLPESAGPIFHILVILLIVGLYDDVLQWLLNEHTGGRIVGFNYTPIHFKTPDLQIIPIEIFAGTLRHFGVYASLAILPIILIFIYFLLRILESFKTEENGDHNSIYALPKISISDKKRKEIVAIVIAGFFIAISVKIASVQPLKNNVSFFEKLNLTSNFYIAMNKALASKVLLDEQKYEILLFEALLLDSETYLWFSDSWYWAYYLQGNKVKKTYRQQFASWELFEFYEKGLLRDRDLVPASKIMKKAGDMFESGIILSYLRSKYPNDLEIALLASKGVEIDREAYLQNEKAINSVEEKIFKKGKDLQSIDEKYISVKEQNQRIFESLKQNLELVAEERELVQKDISFLLKKKADLLKERAEILGE